MRSQRKNHPGRALLDDQISCFNRAEAIGGAALANIGPKAIQESEKLGGATGEHYNEMVRKAAVQSLAVGGVVAVIDDHKSPPCRRCFIGLVT